MTFPGTVASLRQMWGRAGPARARAGRLRRRRGRAGPVLLPPPRRVPRAPGRGGDRLARERADPPRPPAVRRARGPAGRATDAEILGPRWQAYARRCSSRRATLVERRGQLPPAPPRGLPGRARVAALGVARQRSPWSTSPAASCSGTVEAARAHSTRSTTARSTCTSGAPTRSASSTSTRAARSSTPFDGNWYTQPKTETMTEIERLLDRREALGVDAELRHASP